MSTAAQFVIAKQQQLETQISTDRRMNESINQQWYIHSMGHYPAMKINKHGYMHQHGSMLEKHNYTYKTVTIMGEGGRKISFGKNT